MNITTSSCVFMFLLALPASSGAAAVKEGLPAPRVSMQLLRDGAVSDFPGWEAYRGKVVVVELWGTWCTPCVAGIPHMNAIQKALEGKPVEFLSVTDESAETVRKFLKRHPMSGTLGVAGKDAIFAMGTGSFPQTIIIGKKGEVLRYTLPEEVTEQNLSRLLETGSAAAIKRVLIEKSAPKNAPKNATKAAAPPLFELQVSSEPYDENTGNGRSPNFSTVTEDYRGNLRFMLSMAYGVSRSNVEVSSSLPPQKFRFRISVPRVAEGTLKPLLAQAVKAAFGVGVRRAEREKRVLLLRYDSGAPQPGLLPSSGGGSSMRSANGSLRATGASAGELAGLLEGLLGVQMADETGLAGRYSISLDWTPGDEAALRAALKERLGLTLESALRKEQVLQAFPAEDPPLF